MNNRFFIRRKFTVVYALSNAHTNTNINSIKETYVGVSRPHLDRYTICRASCINKEFQWKDGENADNAYRMNSISIDVVLDSESVISLKWCGTAVQPNCWSSNLIIQNRNRNVLFIDWWFCSDVIGEAVTYLVSTTLIITLWCDLWNG